MLNKRIKDLRIQRDMTQKQLADIIGLTPKMISFYELAERVPPPDILEKLADIFHVTVDYLLCRADEIQCAECGFSYSPLTQIVEHEKYHAKWKKAIEKFGFCYGYREAENIRLNSIRAINDRNSTEEKIINAFDEYLHSEFSLSLLNSGFDLNHVEFEEFASIELGKWQSKDAVSGNVYKKLVDKYGVDNSRYYHPVINTNSKPPIKIPVLGYVRAGIPIDAVEEILDYEEISEEMARQGEYFALQIKGDSMEPRIQEGDVVIVRKQSTIDSGDIAVVLVNGNDATVKKFVRHDNGVSLVAANAKYDPMFYTPQEVSELPVTVLGKVVELRGKF